MKELFNNQTMRFLVYLSISFFSVTTIYGSFIITAMYQDVAAHKRAITDLKIRMEKREEIASTYVPLILSIKALVDSHQDVLKRIMDRQAHMNKILERPLENGTIKKGD